MDCPLVGEKQGLNLLFRAESNVHQWECPLITCPPFRKFFRRLWPEFGRWKQNCPQIRGVRFLRCPLIGENTVIIRGNSTQYIFFYSFSECKETDLISGFWRTWNSINVFSKCHFRSVPIQGFFKIFHRFRVVLDFEGILDRMSGKIRMSNTAI